MFRHYSRRNLFQMAGAAAAAMLGSRIAGLQQPQADPKLKWQGLVEEPPRNMGWMRPICDDCST